MANLVKLKFGVNCEIIKTKTIIGGGTMPLKHYPSVGFSV